MAALDAGLHLLNFTVVVGACTNLANPVWQPLQTNTLINGSWENFNAGLCAIEGNILHDSWQVTHDTHYERIFAEFGALVRGAERAA